jgi:hypothetical protein
MAITDRHQRVKTHRVAFQETRANVPSVKVGNDRYWPEDAVVAYMVRNWRRFWLEAKKIWPDYRTRETRAIKPSSVQRMLRSDLQLPRKIIGGKSYIMLSDPWGER